MDLIRISQSDNVAVALRNIVTGETVIVADQSVTVCEPINRGHKIALVDIIKGENVIKYGFPLGHATEDIAAGQHVHTHNCKTNLADILHYEYRPVRDNMSISGENVSFMGYQRPDGRVGTRNEIWIIPTVSCVNRNAQVIASMANEKFAGAPNVDGIQAITHPYGCSQMGQDQLNTQKVLACLARHPNAGGVLILGLGCENNNIAEFKKILGEYDDARIKFLVAQDVEDEILEGVALISELVQQATLVKRENCGVDHLIVGLKCGGSDGLSGITANPLLGDLSDALISSGGSSVLTEVPEMFGAETILMNRAETEGVFDKIVLMINEFKQYYIDHGQPVYENPSPGNKAGGITTLEEKSLGCTQKGGHSIVRDVIDYGERASIQGLSLLKAPGNDMVAATALAAAGCQIILFSTGRGTPLGTIVPTIKVSTNSELYVRKHSWMDFDAGSILKDRSLDFLRNEFLQYVLSVASGQQTKAEKLGFKEIAIFKNGVTL